MFNSDASKFDIDLSWKKVCVLIDAFFIFSIRNEIPMKNECKQLHNVVLTMHESKSQKIHRNISYNLGKLLISTTEGISQHNKASIVYDNQLGRFTIPKLSTKKEAPSISAIDDSSNKLDSIVQDETLDDLRYEPNSRTVIIKYPSLESSAAFPSTVPNKGAADTTLVIPGLQNSSSSTDISKDFGLIHDSDVDSHLTEETPDIQDLEIMKTCVAMPTETTSKADEMVQPISKPEEVNINITLLDRQTGTPSAITESAKTSNRQIVCKEKERLPTPSEGKPTRTVVIDNKNDLRSRIVSKKGDTSSSSSIGTRLEKVITVKLMKNPQ